MSLRGRMFRNIQTHAESTIDKISVIGAGVVGMAVAVSILGSRITKNLVLVDAFGDTVKGEVLDLQQAALVLQGPTISGGTDFSTTQGSKLCILTAGVRQETGETMQSLAQRNSDIMVKLVPDLVKYSPETIILVVGNPVDVLTYVVWKVSGLPHHRVIGSGTTLDTQRFRILLAKKLNVNPADVKAWIIGNHGEQCMAVWSSVNIAGVRMNELNPLFGSEGDPENWNQIYKLLVSANGQIEQLKGYTNWGIAMSVAAIAKTIIGNRKVIFPVSVNANGNFGITEDVFIPLPAVLGINGVYDIINLKLTPEEITNLQKVASSLMMTQKEIVIKGADIDCRCRRCRT
ncbi:hypothetical protein WA026_001709 [Henosepilachna vigintioctopunctata]|uniref:L-lactate dehydrogenase n=1 Tax=Henosepilachna vigintioctopunctata TaxID=420089 RepID=A0AAW1USM2_9CUCU